MAGDRPLEDRLAKAAALSRARWPGVVLLLTAVAVVPTRAAFGAPKTWLLAGAAAVSLAVALSSRRPALALAPLLLAATTVGSALLGDAALAPAVLLQVVGALLLVAWTATGVELERTLPFVVAAGAVVGAVASLQALGLDPFAGFGPSFAGARLRVYGTLGNPDFVAALLVPTLVLTLPQLPSPPTAAPVRARRWLLVAAAVAQAGGLVAARSFAAVLCVLVAAGVLALHGERRQRLRVVAPLLALGVLASLGLFHRDAVTAASGRLYLWRVAAPHVLEAPLLGRGPGSVEALWAGWEAQAWSRGAFGEESRRFAAVQNHLHNDFLERALEQGLAGLAALGLVLVAALRRLRRSSSRHAPALIAALAALATRALVDFPLARPAELCLFVLLVAVALSPRLEES